MERLKRHWGKALAVAFISLCVWAWLRDRVAYGTKYQCLLAAPSTDSTIDQCTALIKDADVNAATKGWAYSTLGDIFENTKHDMDAAITNYRASTQIDPDSANHLFSLGEALRARNHAGDCDESVSIFSRAIQLVERQSSTYYNRRGLAYACLKQYEYSLEDLNKAIRLNPIKYFYYSDRAAVLRAMGKDDKAQEDLESAKILEPRKGEALCIDMNYPLALGCWGYKNAWFR